MAEFNLADIHPKDAITGLATDLSVWGGHQGGLVGNLALYTGAVFGGVADLLPNTPGQVVFSLAAGAVGGSLLGKAISGLEGLAATSPLASWLAADASTVASGVGTSLGQTADGMIGSALDRFGFRLSAVESGPGPALVQGSEVALSVDPVVARLSGGEANAAQYAQLKAQYAALDPGYVPVSGADVVTINSYTPLAGKEAEFMRQLLQDQEAGLNSLTAGEIKANMENYAASNGRPPDAAAAIRAYRADNAVSDDVFAQEYLAENPSARLAVTHGPDSIIGGAADGITGYGDLSVNSSIGAQNKYVASQIYNAVSLVPPSSYITFLSRLKH